MFSDSTQLMQLGEVPKTEVVDRVALNLEPSHLLKAGKPCRKPSSVMLKPRHKF